MVGVWGEGLFQNYFGGGLGGFLAKFSNNNFMLELYCYLYNIHSFIHSIFLCFGEV